MPDERLLCIASMVRENGRVADIGTDHAYLPIHLVQTGRCPSAIASDVRVGPTESARRNVAEAGLSLRIDVRLGDGLSGISPDEVDDIVIAGMGGETIAAILEAAAWVQNPRYRLVLQPMTRAEELRRYLLTNGFSIRTEQVIRDGHRLYTVMTAAYTAQAPVTDETQYYRGALGKEGRAYLEKEVERLKKKQEGCCRAGHTEDALHWQHLIEALEADV